MKAGWMIRLCFFTSLSFMLLVLSGFIFESNNGVVCVWGYVFCPVLWLLWLGTVFQAKNNVDWFWLLKIWLLIDFSILGLLLLSSKNMRLGDPFSGDDVAMLIAYAPVVFPMIYVLGDAISFFHHLFLVPPPDSIRDLVVVGWLDFSFIAAMQSMSLFLLVKYTKRKNRGAKITRPLAGRSASPNPNDSAGT